MSRTYEYHDSNYYGGDSRSSVDEYLERINRMQRTPSVIDDYSDAPHAHKFYNNNSPYAEKHDDHHVKISHVNHQHQAPEEHKKVHFSEHQRTVEIGRDGNREVYAEKTIDVEADGFIQQRHKNFDSSSTFRAY